MKYRITKYDPCFRDKNGRYLLNDWTSISDIGKSFSGGVLTEKEYYEKEQQYLKAIEILLAENNVNRMSVLKMEKYEKGLIYRYLSEDEKNKYDDVEVGSFLNVQEIIIVSKLVLREMMWTELIAENKNFKIEFGYDYYMYVTCKNMNQDTKIKVLKTGLYVEQL